MKKIDLHVHSNQSDGSMLPADVVQLAAESGLSAFALTDHDTTDGLAEAFAAAANYGLEVIPGIEFSTEYQERDIHIVGLQPDWTHPDFQERLSYYRAERLRRDQKMITLMAADGIDISFEKMQAAFPRMPWTRTHFARYLEDHGYVEHMWDAFQTHIGTDCPYFVQREKISPMEAVRLIRQFHGIPILAHPFQYKFTEQELCTMLEELCAAGLIGMEVYYSTHSDGQTAYLLELAARYNLAPSGGSDFHGTNKPDIFLGTGKNNLQIPYELLENLRKKWKDEENKDDIS